MISKTDRIITWANAITVSGIIFAIAATWLAFEKQLAWSFICLVAGFLTDFLDGQVARRIEKKRPGYGVSVFGANLDPIRDKMLLLPLWPMFNFYNNGELTVLFSLCIGLIFLAEFILARAFSFLYFEAIKVNNIKKKIPYLSKVLTFLQGVVFAVLLIKFYLIGLQSVEFCSAIVAIMIISITRVSMYFILYLKNKPSDLPNASTLFKTLLFLFFFCKNNQV